MTASGFGQVAFPTVPRMEFPRLRAFADRVKKTPKWLLFCAMWSVIAVGQGISGVEFGWHLGNLLGMFVSLEYIVFHLYERYVSFARWSFWQILLPLAFMAELMVGYIVDVPVRL